MQGKYKALWINNENLLEVIDQTKLPFSYETKVLKTTDDIVNAIKNMTVRGAGVIGSVAAFGVYIAALESKNYKQLIAKADCIKKSRPTAINLAWAVDKMIYLLKDSNNLSVDSLKYAIEINDFEAKQSLKIAKIGCNIIEKIAKSKNNNSVNILTHCNAGWLAVIDEGTALAPLYEAKRKGINIHVWVDETRPRNQGSSLTAWELKKSNINYTVIADNTGGYLMQQNMIDMVIVGADRVSSNGDVVNKIGTYLKALAAKDNNIPFYVAIPLSTIDWDIKDSFSEIPIEIRDQNEVKYIQGLDNNGNVSKILLTPQDCKALNYGFDITPSNMVTAFITNDGLVKSNNLSILK